MLIGWTWWTWGDQVNTLVRGKYINPKITSHTYLSSWISHHWIKKKWMLWCHCSRWPFLKGTDFSIQQGGQFILYKLILYYYNMANDLFMSQTGKGTAQWYSPKCSALLNCTVNVHTNTEQQSYHIVTLYTAALRTLQGNSSKSASTHQSLDWRTIDSTSAQMSVCGYLHHKHIEFLVSWTQHQDHLRIPHDCAYQDF